MINFALTMMNFVSKNDSRRQGMRGAGAKNLLIMEFIEGERITDGAKVHLDEAGTYILY